MTTRRARFRFFLPFFKLVRYFRRGRHTTLIYNARHGLAVWLVLLVMAVSIAFGLIALLREHFYKMQEWATGAEPGLQITALLQLRDFLRGDDALFPRELVPHRRHYVRMAREFFQILLRNRELYDRNDSKSLDGLPAETGEESDPGPRAEDSVAGTVMAVLRSDGWRIRDLSGCDLNRFNLAGADLHGVSLRASRLNHAIVSDANLRGANLSEAEMNHAELFFSELQNAKLTLAKLRHANLKGAKMSRARFWSTELAGARLGGANLHAADLRGAKMHGARLRGANLRHADLRGTELHKAKLHHADLRNADLRGAEFQGANLQGANLYGTEAGSANLNESFLEESVVDKKWQGEITGFHGKPLFLDRG